MAAIRRPAFEETSCDVTCVDVHVNGAKTLSGVSYKTVSKYLSVPPGQYRFEVRPAGADAGSKAVIDASDTLAAGKAVTVAAVGALANIKGQVYNDDISAPASGKAKVRVVHAARTAAIIALRLVEDVDLGHRRLTIAGRVRPIDELTHQILREWLDYRRTRWPCTANPPDRFQLGDLDQHRGETDVARVGLDRRQHVRIRLVGVDVDADQRLDPGDVLTA